jgi:hypothetical protein
MTNATNTTNSPGRRSFLAGAAALTVAASLGSPVMAYQGEPEPIFAAIEAHKAITAMALTTLKTHSALERELPRDRRQSSVDALGETIVATDDPRWIASERAVAAAWDTQEEAACVLVSIVPTTLAGVIALLQYANTAADSDGDTWPSVLQTDDGSKSRSWHYFMIENVSAALTDLVQA